MGAPCNPFHFELSQDEISDLRWRLEHTRWPDPETSGDWRQGVRSSWIAELADYWCREFDWAVFERAVNRFPQFTTEIDGQPFHFVHVRSKEKNALPLVLTHGWPGSVVEFLDVIKPLVDPTVTGGDAADAFHVVCPSLPGFGFSAKPSSEGWDQERIADAWAVLMERLGYPLFVAQGGDWGSFVSSTLARRHADRLIGIHLNMVIVPPDPDTADDPTPFETEAMAEAAQHLKSGRGYSEIQSTRPQTIGYALTDSPAGLLAWITDKFWAWTDHDGDPYEALTRDQILSNVSLYWFTRTPASSARLYWESAQRIAEAGLYRQAKPVPVPAALSIFPREIVRPSRRWCEKYFDDLRFYEIAPKGGHFAAFEQPEIFIDQVRRGVRRLR